MATASDPAATQRPDAVASPVEKALMFLRAAYTVAEHEGDEASMEVIGDAGQACNLVLKMREARAQT